MRRLIAIGTLAVALPVLALVGLGASDGGGSGYRVRAIFDSVAAAVPGEDVKIAGARVGSIDSMDVTPQKKAAVVLEIEDERFAPFRSDASCTIRPQSLIGEKFVECKPGTQAGSPLRKIESGEGEGDYLLPLARTSSPVDLDLINNTLRLPFRERLAILLNEFGTGLAGRGEDLNEVIHRANPALRNTDRVLRILARQNDVLGRLARDSDTVLGPLARERVKVADWVVQANHTAQATAERRADIRGSLARLPSFLRELRPLMADLEGFADQGTPVVHDLGVAAPDLGRLTKALGPFSEASIPAVRSLGRALVRGRPALIRARPLIQDLGRFANDARPVSTNLADLTASLKKTGGLERILDYLFFQTIAVNGFDSIGHYLRAGLVVNLCTTYATSPASGCNSRFTTPTASSASLGPQLAEIHPDRKPGGSVPPNGGLFQGLLGPAEDPAARRERERHIKALRERAEEPSPGLDGAGGSKDPMLDYLLGSEK
jgi:virulence factor Mce-like protein